MWRSTKKQTAWSPMFIFIIILLETSAISPWFICQLLVYLFFLVTFFLYVIIYYLHHQCWFTTVKKNVRYIVSTTEGVHSYFFSFSQRQTVKLFFFYLVFSWRVVHAYIFWIEPTSFNTLEQNLYWNLSLYRYLIMYD